MKTIKVENYNIKKEDFDYAMSVSGKIYGGVEYSIVFKTKDDLTEKKVGRLGEDGLLLMDDSESCVLIRKDIHITNWNKVRNTRVKGLCRSDPEVIDDEESIVKELI